MEERPELQPLTEEPLSGTSKQPGLPPGTPVFTGEALEERVSITVMDYDATRCDVKHLARVEDAFPYRETSTVSWINVVGLHDVEPIQRLGEHFGLHSLVIEDIVHTTQRPKLELYDGYIYIVMKMLLYRHGEDTFDIEQVSMVLGENFVLTFQERQGDIFDPVRNRIKNSVGRIRKVGPDYLLYALMDSVVDNYFIVLEAKSDKVEDLDERLLEDPGPENLNIIRALKRRMLLVKRAVWPLRDVMAALLRDETPLVHEGTRVFLRDIYDHTVQAIDMVETLREMISGMMDLHLSSLSNRMNEIMKVLTIIAAIFIPLTFIAGIYGMNFEHMPELRFRYGYYGVLGVMAVAALAMLIYFRRKKWF